MRIPVFASRSNPTVDLPILRKSRFYAELQVREGRADWVDYADPRKGIVCRELLNFGVKRVEPETDTSINWAELPGVRYIPAKMDKNPTLPRLHIETLSECAANWDWA